MLKNKEKIFIGVAWPYVNGDLHIGHLAGYLLPADIYARFHRFLGNDVLMVSGSDCFGTPVTVEAEKRKVLPIDIVEEYHSKNVELFNFLGLSYDLYTKTNTENHKKIVQDIFLAMFKNGYIQKNNSLQYYSEEEKRFLPDRYVEGICPHCSFEGARSDQCDECGSVLNQGDLVKAVSKISGGEVSLKESEHYFVDWGKFEVFLKKYVNNKKGEWKDWIYTESKKWLEKELKPRAITRDLEWGVELPIDRIPEEFHLKNIKNKRIYVWFEAVAGYLSASIEWSKKGENRDWKDYWYNNKAKHYYFMGKDNLIFHTLFWPAQLYSYDKNIKLPDIQMINQFLTFEGKSFSKSRGITINPKKLSDDFGLDIVRFYLTLIMPEKYDTSFAWDDFISKTNNVIIGNLGNFINRTLKLGEGINFKGEVDEKIQLETDNIIKKAKINLMECNFKKYAEDILSLSDYGNKYLSATQPWIIKKKSEDGFSEIIKNSLYIVLGLNVLMKPIIPNSAEKLNNMLGINFELWPDSLTEVFKKIKISNSAPLFNKINSVNMDDFDKKYK